MPFQSLQPLLDFFYPRLRLETHLFAFCFHPLDLTPFLVSNQSLTSKRTLTSKVSFCFETYSLNGVYAVASET